MTPETPPIAETRAVEKFYAQPSGIRVQVIAPTDLAITSGSFTALLGPSGSGKSTLLRMLTGLVRPSAGQVLWHGQPLAKRQPDASIVFQNFALFPWLTVLENVEAPLQARGVDPAKRRKDALKILDTVGLDGSEFAYPKELSGGMKQRVGFARALVVQPEVLFMDEPFSALDVLSVETLRNELLELWLGRKIPTKAIFMVTHNIEEAVFLADRVIVLGRNPASIRTDFQVYLKHPRDRKAPEFTRLVDYIYKVLTQPGSVPPKPGTGVPSRTAEPSTPLPHTRPGTVAGFVEIMLPRKGTQDIYVLADDLAMEVDDLLPILDAAVLLGFVRVHEGDIELTPAGYAFAEADIQSRKALFKDAASNVPLLRRIQRGLENKRNHELHDDFFLDVLEEHYTDAEARRQLDTAISWGRYAELFDYDAASGLLMLTEPGEPEPESEAERMEV
jgi:NitT/TauT family transport system ATP-binding protein